MVFYTPVKAEVSGESSVLNSPFKLKPEPWVELST